MGGGDGRDRRFPEDKGRLLQRLHDAYLEVDPVKNSGATDCCIQ